MPKNIRIERRVGDENPEGRIKILQKGTPVRMHPDTVLARAKGNLRGVITQVGSKYMTVQFDGLDMPVKVMPGNLEIV
jgi:hypothetical protein